MSNNNNWFSKLFISEAKKAIEYHNSVGGGSGGGGSTGLIEVEEFPTTDVDSSSVYKKTTTSGGYECLIAMNGQPIDVINMLKSQGMNATLTAVDSLDSVTNPLVTDGASEIHIYIPKSEGFGYIYGPFGADGSNIWMKFSVLMNGADITDVVVTEVPSTLAEYTLYWVKPSSSVEYGIPDSEAKIYNYSDPKGAMFYYEGAWVDVLTMMKRENNPTLEGYLVVDTIPDESERDKKYMYIVKSDNSYWMYVYSTINAWIGRDDCTYIEDPAVLPENPEDNQAVVYYGNARWTAIPKDLIEVDEFPTTDVDSSLVYKKITTTGEYECWAVMNGEVINFIEYATQIYGTVTLTTVESLDVVVFPKLTIDTGIFGTSAIHIYVPKTEGIGYVYGAFGENGENTWATYMSACLKSGTMEFTTTQIPKSTDPEGVYWVNKLSTSCEYGITDSEADIYNYSETVEVKMYTALNGWINYIDELNLFVSAIGSTQLRYSGYKVVENLPDNPDVTIVYVVTSENKVYMNNFGGAFDAELNTWCADSNSVYFIDDYNDVDVGSESSNGLYVKRKVSWNPVRPVCPESKKVKVGDVLGDTLGFDTTKNLDEFLASLNYTDGRATLASIEMPDGTLVPIFSMDVNTMSEGASGGYVVGWDLGAIYISYDVSDAFLNEVGALSHGWVVSEVRMPELVGCTFTFIHDDIDCVVIPIKLATAAEIKAGYIAFDGTKWIEGEDSEGSALVGLIDGSLTELVIPDGTSNIRKYAFYYNDKLTSVYIPDSVTSIGESALYGCTSLTSITIGQNNTVYKSIDGNLYSIDGKTLITYAVGKTDTSFTIPDGVTSIKENAFFLCGSLTSVTIPNSVTSIDREVFAECTGLSSITVLSETPPTFDSSALRKTPADLVIYVPAGSVEAYKSATNWSAYADRIQAIPELAYSLRSDNASYRVDGIGTVTDTDIVIPDTYKGLPVTEIKSSAFSGNTNMTSVEVPESVKIIGDWAFNSCTGLTSAKILARIGGFSAYTFNGCTNLTSITLPETIISFGSSSFNNCGKICEVHFKGTIEKWLTIGNPDYRSNPFQTQNNALYIDDKLVTEVVIPDGFTTVRRYAFYGCTDITNVEIPSTIKSFDDSAFSYCTGIERVNFTGSVDQWVEIDGSSSPARYTNTFCINGVEVNDVVLSTATKIGNYAFYGSTWLRSIEMSNSVTSIGSNAFYKCTGLTSVEISSSVTSIGDRIFEGCTGLTSVTIPNNVTSIGNYTFQGCTGLTSVMIPDGVTSIGEHAFYNCSGLTEIVIPNNVTSIGNYTFQGCTGLTSVTIPEGVTSIGLNAFNGSKLTSITIPSSVTTISTGAFGDCTALTKVNYTGTIDQWSEIIFSGLGPKINPVYYTKKLYINDELVTEVNLTTATKINYYVFPNCTDITSVVISDTVTSIGECAFYGCTGLTEITIPSGVTNIMHMAFSGCSNLASITVLAETPPTLVSSAISSSYTNVIYVPAESVEAYKSATNWSNYADKIQAITE